MIDSAEALARWVLTPGAVAAGSFDRIRDLPYDLSNRLQKLAGESARFEIAPSEAKTNLSLLAAELERHFPGRYNFTRQLAEVVELFFRRQFNEVTNPESGWTGVKPNVIVVGGESVGKSHLLGRVLPAVVPGYLKSDRAGVNPCVVHLDARHLSTDFLSMRSSFGPVPCAHMLVASGSEDLDTWLEGYPVMVCIDHLEAVWKRHGESRGMALDPEAFAVALSAVIRGIRCAVPHSSHSPHGPGETLYLATHQILFVAVVHLDRLRSEVEKSVDETGTCMVKPGDLVKAGMPECLAREFPVLLVLPPLTPGAFRKILKEGQHPGFTALDRAAKTLNLNVALSDLAIDLLFELTWNGRPDFLRLNQLLTGLAALLKELPPNAEKLLGIDAEQVYASILRTQIFPGDIAAG